MGLQTALYTSLSGLDANSQAIAVSGNNIANINTTAYKAGRISFETQISRTIRSGSAPDAERGGTNPAQIGLGTRTAAIGRDFSFGALQSTGVNTDLAIEGNGLFIVNRDGETRYTRAGTFQLDRDFKLVDSDGGRVQGFAVNSDFQIISGTLGDLAIPVGSLTMAEPTETVNFAGNLNAGGDAATAGALITSDALFSDVTGTTPAVATDSLTSLFDGTGKQLFNLGDVITLTGAEKGDTTLPDHTFEVGLTNTTGSDTNGDILQTYLDFLEDVLGIDTAVSGSATVSAAGQISIEGNSGLANDLTIESSNIITNQSSSPDQPFSLTKQTNADGESVRTTFVAFDSLGTPLTINLTVVLEQKTNAGTAWRFYVQSEDDSDLDRVLGSGTIDFDTNGQLSAVSNAVFTIDRVNSGATTPQQITVMFDNPDGSVSALAGTVSQMSAISQDGAATGTLSDFSVAEDGAINGGFTNGLLRTLGQVVLAEFANVQGLEDVGDNLFRETVNSGTAAVVTPLISGAGRIIGGALELSNVDLAQEFVNLITASTGFAANSRVLTTSDRLIQELLSAIR